MLSSPATLRPLGLFFSPVDFIPPNAAEAKKNLLDLEPEEVVEKALQALLQAGVELIEWRAPLYRRMSVPVILKNYSYIIPDDDVGAASDILASIGLPVSPPSRFLLRVEGDLQAMGRFHQITRSTEPAWVQHIVLYPSSFLSILPSELLDLPCPSEAPSPSHRTIRTPRPSAVYAVILRSMLRYRRLCSTRTVLASDLSELIDYHLCGISGGYIDADDESKWKEEQVDKRIDDAVHIVRQWGLDGEWREGEEWMGDALAAFVAGTGDIDYMPWSSCHS